MPQRPTTENPIIDLLDCEWRTDSPDVTIINKGGELIVRNCSITAHGVFSKKKLAITASQGYVVVEGHCPTGDSAIFYLTGASEVTAGESTLNSQAFYPFGDYKDTECWAAIWINPHSEIVITKATLSFTNDKAMREEFLFASMKSDTLVISPDYPAPENKYLAGFVHTRVASYLKANISLDLFVVTSHKECVRYEYEGVSVLKCSFEVLRQLLMRKKYQKILVHFFDEQHARAFESCDISGTELIFWVHGPETLYWDWPCFTTGYFKHLDAISSKNAAIFKMRDSMIRRYNAMENVTWVFVSDWIKEHSEKLIGISFNKYRVIPNYVDEAFFSYTAKDEELRKKVFLLRRFDDVNKYAIDVSVRCIMELSRRACFEDLEFNIFGSGAVHELLVAPLRNFENVKIHSGFLSHEQIAAAHREHGIGLFATRYDAQGVSMCEAAMSGLAIVSSDNPALTQFLPDGLGLLADTEDHRAYADTIEKLATSPELFLECSKACHEKIASVCSFEQTIGREIALINEPSRQSNYTKVEAVEEPVLTVVVPTYNAQYYLKGCIASLVNQRNAHLLEVLIVNDGSADDTKQIAQEILEHYNCASHPIIRLINKENGGHGSTINTGLSEARGKYFRIIDCDDWVDSKAFAELLDRLQTDSVSIVLTDYSEDRVRETALEPKKLYGMLAPGVEYKFDDLCYPGYGFDVWGPVLATGNFMTQELRETNFKLSEHSCYVDMEFDMYAILNAQTVKYYPLDIYRYVIGNDAQTISRASFLRNSAQHERILLNLIEYVQAHPEINSLKKDYITEKLIVPMAISQYLIVADWKNSKEGFIELTKVLSQWNWVIQNPLLAQTIQGYKVKFSFERKTKDAIKRVLKAIWRRLFSA